MAHISTVGSAIWTQLNVAKLGEATQANYIEIPNLRGSPQVGNEASITQVPQYRTASALNIGVQATTPDFEFELNFIPNTLIHQALFLSAGFLGGTNVRSSADPDHPDSIVLDNTGALNPSGAAGASDTVFSAGNNYSFQLILRNAQSGDNSGFSMDGQIAGFATGPSLDDATVATVTLSLSTVPNGPWTI